jgi:hypothetical protein
MHKFPSKIAGELRNEVGKLSNISVRMIQDVIQKQQGLLARKAASSP